MTLKIDGTIVFEKNWEAIHSNKRFIINQGGSRSSKTRSLVQCMILYCLSNSNKVITIVRKEASTLRRSVLKSDLLPVLKDWGLYGNVVVHNKTDGVFTFGNGSTINLIGADDEQKLRGMAHDLVWCNEGNELSYDDFQQLALRCRDKLILDYNPSSNSSWIYDIPEEKSIFIHSTYKDNPFLTKEQVEQIESYKYTDLNYYTIFALGKRANSKENVYSEWETSKTKPHELNDFVYGLDFGFTHPTALVKIWYNADEKINTLYVEEMIYETGLTSLDLVNLMIEKGIDKNKPIIADYARPEIIEDIRKNGFLIYNAIKEVKDGINNVKQFKVILSEWATNLIKENQLYKYKKINGEIVDDVIKLWDDGLDALRYGVFHIKKHLRYSGQSPYDFSMF